MLHLIRFLGEFRAIMLYGSDHVVPAILISVIFSLALYIRLAHNFTSIYVHFAHSFTQQSLTLRVVWFCLWCQSLSSCRRRC